MTKAMSAQGVSALHLLLSPLKRFVPVDRWKYEFMRDIITKVTDLTLTPKVQYQAVLDLDRKVREKPLPAYLNSFLGSEVCSPLVYLRKCLLAHYRASSMSFQP